MLFVLENSILHIFEEEADHNEVRTEYQRHIDNDD
jgi:hypothetical protein